MTHILTHVKICIQPNRTRSSPATLPSAQYPVSRSSTLPTVNPNQAKSMGSQETPHDSMTTPSY
ncbi:hypothetical protein DSO57_1003482 [Entomophthora muscae]|uniref:Uncharacterized protein n=1 Tax=Entomophthora muscae TaxID=34485 RepID=A0ACC2RNB4_9FUNG|nr:hypothetical protein DSO57_1003482 [Entomophthora muscae]